MNSLVSQQTQVRHPDLALRLRQAEGQLSSLIADVNAGDYASAADELERLEETVLILKAGFAL